MWPDLIQKAKDSALDVIETYVFWNGHEPSPGQVSTHLVKLFNSNLGFFYYKFYLFFHE